MCNELARIGKGEKDMSNNALESESSQSVEINDLVCFAIYSASTAMNRTYKPYLSKLGLTYPQYITLSALWHEDGVTVGHLCKTLMIETNTLTPILQRLEKQELVTRERGQDDERQVIVRLTTDGWDIKRNQPDIISCVAADTDFDRHTLNNLVASITELRDNLNENNA